MRRWWRRGDSPKGSITGDGGGQGIIVITYTPKTGFSGIYLGDTQINSIKLGSTDIKAVYHGETKIFEAA